MISGTCKISLEGSSESSTLIGSWESINQHNLSGKQLGNIYQDPKYVLTHCLGDVTPWLDPKNAKYRQRSITKVLEIV